MQLVNNYRVSKPIRENNRLEHDPINFSKNKSLCFRLFGNI